MSQENEKILSPFRLPCGVVLSNRIAKAAMTERLAKKSGRVNQLHRRLYGHWAASQAGLLMTGNIMIDKRYKESGGNLVLEDESHISSLKELTKIVTDKNKHLWAQISHPGRQATIFSTFKPVAPSPIRLKKLGLFAKPRELQSIEIDDIINRFVNTARLCKEAGFTGVQFHAAHGYLLSQFLSPRTNKREDEFGGPIENRSRMLEKIISKSRKALGQYYPISVKLNSADFQRGGFDEDDAFYVIRKLEYLGIDLLEISGGTYENIVFLEKENIRESSRQREAYFLDFAKKIRGKVRLPLMVTGGFRSLSFCREVLSKDELDIIGFARPFLIREDFPECLFSGHLDRIKDPSPTIKIRALADMAEGGYYDYQIHRLAQNKSLKPNYNPYAAVFRLTKNELLKGWF